ncbi:SH3 domain-binding protein 5-like isoform X3 [Neoarius graeffei]|uniref:SH3 domain-binding protein 5-like isoform X3 n=1 Tax=Neoarius graeffei TaxID=443677 RepID=UPI00298BECD2|nr:SH3 domain-binding protein 5-like isoform X3 [Neoarius graeffei]
MEPGRLRENPPGSGETEAGGWRGETPGVEAEEERKHSNGPASGAGCVGTGGITVRDDEEEDEDQYKDEELDPRIQEELEHLNQAQQETQKAALRYERAVSMHTAAREMVYVAEQGLLADRNTLDPTWQEMLNHATAKVNEAEEERLRSEREHQRVTQLCQEAEARVQTLQKALKRVIIKSKPYFELKAQFNHILEEHKAKVVQLEERVAKVKTRYSVALRNLEQISEQIHAQRGRARAARQRNRARGGRSSPVGAEAEGIIQAGAYGGVGVSLLDNDWADQEKTRQWVEKHREEGWGQRAEKAGSDSLSVISLQTIASDLEKCDSVEHLGDLSDVSSVIGEEKEGESVFKQGKENETGASGTEGPPRDRENFVKQHHRSVSL